MAFSLLGTLSSLFGFAQAANSVSTIQAAGQVQESQAVTALLDNLNQNAAVARSMNDASHDMIIQNALTGKYAMQQNAAASTYETQLKLANKWMTVLSGSQ